LIEKEMNMAILKKGDVAPAFALCDQRGGTVRLEDFRGRKLLLYFYPKANTPGCTAQACAVRDSRDPLQAAGADVVGISPDDAKAQRTFDETHGLGFPLLCDTGHAVAEAYGVWGERNLYGRKYMGIVRSAFLIDEAGRVAEAWYKISPKETVPKVQKALAARA
jgi:peroxiredoxin Q/BCP